ncbi:MAG: BON domain-containing protein [Williamsia sp.]|nr:BON domain-containing protein [Williamsia sp.]
MNVQSTIRAACFCLLLAGMTGCDASGKDQSVKADLATKAEAEKDFTGVRFTVENGIVNLSGQCATEKARAAVETKARNLYGVKAVVNNITIAPVIIGTDQLLKQGIDSILKQYAAVEAITKDSLVLLKGKIEKDRTKELLAAVKQLQPKGIESDLSPK